MEQLLVSIVIPCFNAAAWIAGAIESVLCQTWPHREILVIDDGSSDDSLAIARGFQADRVRVFHQDNRGASAARNVGLRHARGEYIQYLDADDLLAPDKIERQLSLAARCPPGVLLSGCWARFTQSPFDASPTAEPLCCDAAPVEWLCIKFERNAMMHPAAWLTPRSVVESIGPWDERLSLDDDGEYFNRAVLNSSGIRYCPEAKSYYRSNLAGSLSGRKSERAWKSALLSLELSTDRLRHASDTPEVRHACATALQRFIYDAYPAAPQARHRAAQMIAELGGADLRPSGGPKFRLASRLLGWRIAKRLQVSGWLPGSRN
jgi:glycosyltransferase involved in cell wall biosynthesis